MKFHAQIGDEHIEVEIKREGTQLTAVVDGRSYELEASEPEPGVFLFNHNGNIYEATVSQSVAAGGPSHVRIGSNEFDVRLIDPKRLRGSGSDAAHADGLVEIKSAMPGKVVRVLLEAGAEVEAGTGIVVVEAMKMQNELKAPKAGTIKEIRVKEGAAVGAGDILATIE